MTAQEILKHFKYYKREKENPFEGKDDNASLWWGGEKTFYEHVANDSRFYENVAASLEKAIQSNYVSGPLTDSNKPMVEKVILYYLDLWHGKWFPYDSLDKIYDY